MFERFTDRARKVLVDAQDAAQATRSGFIGLEHLMLALTASDGIAGTVLREAGLAYDTLKEKLSEGLEQVTDGEVLKPPFTPQAKKALELSLRQALRLGHNYIGTEHILLGTLQVLDQKRASAAAANVKAAIGNMSTQLHQRTIEILGGVAEKLPTQSPAFTQALRAARELASGSVVTTTHLLSAVLSDTQSHGAQVLATLGVTGDALAGAIGSVPAEGTSDDPEGHEPIEVRIGKLTLTIDDPALARALRATSPAALKSALEKAFSRGWQAQEGAGVLATGTPSSTPSSAPSSTPSSAASMPPEATGPDITAA